MSVSFLRHSGWFGPEDANKPLNIIGVGATGSYIGLLAAKMGFHSFKIWDPDVVESHNLPNQIYSYDQIGMKKVDAFEKILKAFNPAISIEKHDCYFKSENHKNLLDGPLILTVDTMSARKDIYEAFKLNFRVDNIFETRLGFDYGELNIINNFDVEGMEQWYNTLLNDEDLEEGPCNLRICTTLVAMIASYVVHKVCDMTSCSRRSKTFNYQKKTMFNFNEHSNLKTYCIA